ncbi:MAG TPA: hydrolase [Candidatus Sabulitectum sp.]|nr:hydrolase [Candidatus Sabulitectum sp.]HPF31689.1 hydrolase [Candidatus Sabulitectum sp.]HPJ28559.1 hydrolase [Candidatus Sabulitectum sp.]HPR22936.1 hydrolase [Candidatus Sabulitectum sp.]
MENGRPTRTEAFELLREHNSSQSLINHALSVEAVMRHVAKKHGEDPDKWGVIGLVHDLDYERYPDRHCTMTHMILAGKGWPEDYIRAVMSHAWGICTDVEPVHIMEKYLYAIDELTGLVTACVLVRPSKSLFDLKVKSVKKKWNTKHFAAGASREIMEKGAEMLGVEIAELIQDVIDGMRTVADEIGLDGSAAEGDSPPQ